MFKSIFGLVSLLCVSLPSSVFAEGSTELPNQTLSSAVVVFEIVDFTSETFVWTGQGAIQVTSPAGGVTGLPSGQVFTPTQNGDFSITLSNRSTFDFSVKDAVGNEIPGRVSSTLWNLNQGAETAQNLTGSFFAAIPSGIHTAVIELKLEGFNGIGYSIAGNGIGVNGVNAGRSVPTSGNTVTPEYRMYLNPPDQASYSAIIPNTSNFKFSPTGATQDCAITQAGASSGTFSFTSDAEGTYHLICDLNNDGAFSLNDGDDLFLIGATSIGPNTVNWDGTDTGNGGSPIPVGTFNCELEVATGEFHFAVADAEYSFPGLRLFEVSNAGVKTGLPMYWNDGLLIPRNSNPILDDGSNTVDFSPLGGRLPGNYDDPAIPFTSANPDGTGRAWGHSVNGTVQNGAANTKGDSAILDTFTWVEESISLNVAISAIDPTLDTDLDGLTDYDEACLTGTDPTVRDSDADGIEDLAEIVSNGGSALAPSDSDGDGVIDALEVCADGHLSIPPNEACDDGNAIDGDGCSATCTLEAGFNCPVPGVLCVDVDECSDSSLNFCDSIATCSNTAGAFTCDCPSGYTDANGDGTVCLEIDECAEGTDNCSANAVCTNAPGTFICKCPLGYSGDGTNCALSDSDHDGISDLEECTNLAGAPDSCEDSDGDGIVDYLDLDSDNDGILDSVECITQPCENTDSNGGADYIDLDSDGDGITDAFEAGYADIDGDGQPDNFVDNDGDGVSDLEALEPTDSDDDGTPDFQSFDSDNDGIDDSKEGQDSTNDGNPNVTPVAVDTDGDGIDDAFDPDCGNAADCGGTIGVIAPLSDFDQDGLPDFQDADSDGDGIPDAVECINDAICEDSDLDGTPDYLDLDSDNDGVEDSIEAHDTDFDGQADVGPAGKDTDGDGLDDAFDEDCSDVTICDGVIGAPSVLPNGDNDELVNYQDPDDDNDGIETLQEVTDGMIHGDDPDNDGTPAYLDLDSDGDTISDVAEGTIDPNTGVIWDIDNDGVPDYLDPDSSPIDTDMDGIPDTIECEGDIANCKDSDSDGNPDFQDIDDDNDGITTLVETMDDADGNDQDADGIPNHLDPDSDGDGVLDVTEAHTDGLIPSGADTDGDGLDDAFDNDDGGTTAPTPDTDDNGTPDYLDNDDDGDNILTINEDADADLDPTNDDQDGDGIPNYLDVDSDGDGIPDAAECTLESCEDSDADGILDYLDIDSDDDGIADAIECAAEICPDADTDGIPDYLDGDSDGDGILDIVEGHATGTSPSGTDSDGDGLDDAFDVAGPTPAIDTDDDGMPDYVDQDSDNDGVADVIEGHEGAVSATGNDADNDGIDDAFDVEDIATAPDLDGDGIPDFRDADDDDDGILTIDEDTDGDGDPNNDDADGDGIPDYLDDEDDAPSDPFVLGGGTCSSTQSSSSFWFLLFGIFVVSGGRRATKRQ